MEKMSFYMFSAALITLVFAFGFHLFYLWKQRFGLGTLGTMFTWLGAVFLLGAWAFRWAATGHAPYSNMYEYSMSFALGTTVAYAVVERKYHARTLGAMVLPVAIGLLAYARTLPSEIEPLIPALQNQELLTIHVAMAIISYGVFAVAFGAVGNVEKFIGDLFNNRNFHLISWAVLRTMTLVGLAFVCVATVITVLTVALYNLFAEVFGGNRLPVGADPFAACYGGHQFGSWAGQLGDGRAIALGEVVDRHGGHQAGPGGLEAIGPVRRARVRPRADRPDDWRRPVHPPAQRRRSVPRARTRS